MGTESVSEDLIQLPEGGRGAGLWESGGRPFQTSGIACAKELSKENS